MKMVKMVNGCIYKTLSSKALYNLTLIHSHTDGTDCPGTCGQEEVGIELPTLWSVNDRTFMYVSQIN